MMFLLSFSDDNPSSNLLQGALGSFPVAQGKKKKSNPVNTDTEGTIESVRINGVVRA